MQYFVFLARFTNHEDRHWFDNCVVRVIKQEIGEEYMEDMIEEPYFVDFLRDAPEPTGDEPEDADFESPKVYELVSFTYE